VPVVLDMDAVTFIDSSGISALVAASVVADDLSSSVQICRPSAQVLRVLARTALDTMFLHGT
jgi:anti-anti-sigma factor